MEIIVVDIRKIVPNPLNPRKDISTNTKDMQQIIGRQGFEIGITCYKRGNEYVILSGHRRWYAAKKLKMKEIPVAVVDAPKSEEEELLRLGSVQGGQEDWTEYEWASYTYDMWMDWGCCSFEELAKIMRKSSRWVSERIRIIEYYPHAEILDGFTSGSLKVAALYRLIGWLDKLSKHKPQLVSSLSITMIRSVMLQKIEKRLVSISELRNEKVISEASDEQLKKFFLSSKMKLSDCMLEANEDEFPRLRKEYASYSKKIDIIRGFIDHANLESFGNKQDALGNLNAIRNAVLNKQHELLSMLQKL